MQIPFGTEEQTSVIDKEGSTITTTRKYKDREVMHPVRRRFEIRERVNNQAQEFEAYMKFSDTLAKDPKMLDAAFKVESKENGPYYVVKCWTTLEY